MKYAKALKWLGEAAEGDHPDFTMANTGDELIILKEYGDNPVKQWNYLVQDIKKECPPFYVKKEEIEVIT